MAICSCPQYSLLRLGGTGSDLIDPFKHTMGSYLSLIKQSMQWKELEDHAWLPPTERELKTGWPPIVSSVFQHILCTTSMHPLPGFWERLSGKLQSKCKWRSVYGMIHIRSDCHSLHKALQAGIAVSQYINDLILKILQLIGRKIKVAVKDLSIAIIRSIFQQLQRCLDNQVSNALLVLSKE